MGKPLNLSDLDSLCSFMSGHNDDRSPTCRVRDTDEALTYVSFVNKYHSWCCAFVVRYNNAGTVFNCVWSLLRTLVSYCVHISAS